jgi:hypothetical protein
MRTLARMTVIGGLVIASAVFAGCVRSSNGTWYIQSASMPDGWPELTPVGEVEVKPYPVCRAAVVTALDVEGDGMRPMFMELFRHIKNNDIAMTAPVDMGYDESADEPRMTSMAFLYRHPDQGSAGTDGAVRVENLESRTFASVGVRGSYSARNYSKGLAILEGWLAGHPRWRADGPPRYLGYNSPFVPWFMRYGEVQTAVIERALDDQGPE